MVTCKPENESIFRPNQRRHGLNFVPKSLNIILTHLAPGIKISIVNRVENQKLASLKMNSETAPVNTCDNENKHVRLRRQKNSPVVARNREYLQGMQPACNNCCAGCIAKTHFSHFQLERNEVLFYANH
jgi:hypothetical protein